jgi:hypothetical protein
LFTEEVDAICKATQAASEQAPGVTLVSWLRQLFGFFASKRQIASELLKHTDSGDPLFGGGRALVIAAGEPLLSAAQQAGEIRDDLGIEQVLDLIHAVATIRGGDSSVEPILQTVWTACVLEDGESCPAVPGGAVAGRSRDSAAVGAGGHWR